MGCKQIVRWAAAGLLYAVAAAAILMALYALLSGGAFFWREAILAVLLVPLPIVAGTLLLSGAAQSEEARGRLARACLILLFVLYVAALLYLLFLSRLNGAVVGEALSSEQINLKPFVTVLRYVRALRRGVIPRTALANLLGNAVLFLPMGMLLPLLFPAMRKAWRCLLLVLLLPIAVEAAQLLLRCGSCDVDDALLNFLGAAAGYFLIRIPPVERLLRRMRFLRDGA